MSKKVLITGAKGQLGKTINELYSRNEDDVEFTFVTRAELDITNAYNLKLFFKNNEFDYCINCAAYTNVEQAEKTPEIAYKVNAEGVKYLAEACKAAQTTLIHISTDYVFDGEKKEPYVKEDKPNPINVYGKSKLLGEQYIQDTLIVFFIIRTSWLYSKNYGKNFYRIILQKVKNGEDLEIITDQIGCPTNTENLANYIMDLIIGKSQNFGITHFCDDKAMTWYEFAEEILKECLCEEIKIVKINSCCTFAKRPKYSVLG
jgi:dTDP-4-dehydrorhamnose reductase